MICSFEGAWVRSLYDRLVSSPGGGIRDPDREIPWDFCPFSVSALPFSSGDRLLLSGLRRHKSGECSSSWPAAPFFCFSSGGSLWGGPFSSCAVRHQSGASDKGAARLGI